jgi:hypothetical protein
MDMKQTARNDHFKVWNGGMKLQKMQNHTYVAALLYTVQYELIIHKI